MSQQNVTQKPQARNGPSYGTTHYTHSNNNQINQLTIQQALLIAARAYNSILSGEPPLTTFDREDLSQTLVILTQIATDLVFQQGSE